MYRERYRFFLSERRKKLAAGLIELGNLSIAALLFGQAYGGISFQFKYAVVGVLLFAFSYYSATMILKERHGY